MKRLILTLALGLLVLLSLTATLFAAPVTLSWQPPMYNEDNSVCNDLAGYKIYVGTVSRNVRDYDNYVDVGNETTFVDDMPAGFTYYYAVTAYDTSDNESWYSNEKIRFLLGITKIGIYLPNGTWYLDKNGNDIWDGTPTDMSPYFGGQAGAIPITGDWNGSGTSKIGIYLPNGTWYLDVNGNGIWDGAPIDKSYFFGNQPGARPVVGDWNDSGTSKIGIYLPNGIWYLDKNGNGIWDGTPTDLSPYFGGQTGAVPVIGDWNGSGTAKVGIYLPNGTWYLDKNGNGAWDGTPTDLSPYFGGQTGAVPISGDF